LPASRRLASRLTIKYAHPKLALYGRHYIPEDHYHEMFQNPLKQ
jgi:hypothetical protein